MSQDLWDLVRESEVGKLRTSDIERIRKTFLLPKPYEQKLDRMSQITGLTETILILLGLYMLHRILE
ncbi:MAG: hypothetical protein JSV32_00675, partial [Dehalococcoidia bacterium]